MPSSSLGRALALAALCCLTAIRGVNSETCYGYDGQAFVGNTKCPGSDACCGTKHVCVSNRLCHDPGDKPDVYIRGPCASKPYDSEKCAQICLYEKDDSNKGGFLPRVTVCNDGSLCCENDPDCCEKGAGVFLDENGVIVSNAMVNFWTSYPPVSPGGTERYTVYPSTSRTTMGTSISAATTTATSMTSSMPPPLATETRQTEAPSDTLPVPSPPSSGSANSIGFKVGLALGIPLVALISGIAVYLLMRRHKRRGDQTRAINNNDGIAETFTCQYVEGYNKESTPIVQTTPAEMYTYPLQEGHAELEAPNREQELMGSTGRSGGRRFSFESSVRRG
ncbi:hypothetical protein B0T20DRAFT_358230 [Sordaria brevicollis]|uniref:Mid2 domain-containing protein n=1 Tax=Sordaria brevicollis TaxID=83679 RepID=A0AAE0PAA2_SORBR|nr:hypothetical protein B0T20DRAFT_358230 [Sordaria brevicollis]